MSSAKTLPPPTQEERRKAGEAAAALRRALREPATMGEQRSTHILLARPRRGEWWTTWSNLPGFRRVLGRDGRCYAHELLPGWVYTQREVRDEMILDLEALAELGLRPAMATA